MNLAQRSLALLGLALLPLTSQAQWGGLGDPGWGWKPKPCHFCLEGVEVSLYGGMVKGEGAKATLQVPDAQSPDPEIFQQSVSPEGEHYGVAFRAAFGPRLFIDGGYRTMELEGDSNDLSVERSYQHLRYGVGAFLFHEPRVVALYLRAGGQSVSSEASYSLAGDPTAAPSTRDGFSLDRDVDTIDGFGGGVGGIWFRGSMRVEAQFGIYGDVQEGELVLTRAFNKGLGLRLHVNHLSLKGVGGPLAPGGLLATDDRRLIPELATDESILSYGLGLLFSF